MAVLDPDPCRGQPVGGMARGCCPVWITGTPFGQLGSRLFCRPMSWPARGSIAPSSPTPPPPGRSRWRWITPQLPWTRGYRAAREWLWGARIPWCACLSRLAWIGPDGMVCADFGFDGPVPRGGPAATGSHELAELGLGLAECRWIWNESRPNRDGPAHKHRQK